MAHFVQQSSSPTSLKPSITAVYELKLVKVQRKL